MTFPVRLLPTDDPYVKAYSHRGRFVPQLYQGSVITKFGESSPVVLIDGIVHGFWSLDGRTCVIEMVAGPEGYEREIRAAAENVGQVLHRRVRRCHFYRVPRKGVSRRLPVV